MGFNLRISQDYSSKLMNLSETIAQNLTDATAKYNEKKPAYDAAVATEGVYTDDLVVIKANYTKR